MIRQRLAEQLHEHINKNYRGILKGLPGIGKTQFIHSYCLQYYKEYVYVDCEVDIVELMEMAGCAKKTPECLYNYLNDKTEFMDLDDYMCIVFFDNIENCDVFIKEIYPALKRLKINVLMSLTLVTEIAKPILDEVRVFQLNPMSYMDFMLHDDETTSKMLLMSNINALSPVPFFLHENCQRTYEEYICVGGMPQCIPVYFDALLSDQILRGTHDAAHLYMLEKLFERANLDEKTVFQCYQVINSVIEQMVKTDYTKFVIGAIRDGVTYTKYRKALDFLEDNRILLKIPHYENPHKFLYYLYDVGILKELLYEYCAKHKIYNRYEHIELMLKRNYTAMELIESPYKIYYWKSRYTAMVDFVIEGKKNLVVIKVFDEPDLRNKSLYEFEKRFNDKNCCLVNLCAKKIDKSKKIILIPFYSISGIFKLVK